VSRAGRIGSEVGSARLSEGTRPKAGRAPTSPPARSTSPGSGAWPRVSTCLMSAYS